MRRSASETIRSLEMRIARLEKQSAKEKTLFERASNADKKKVHEILRDEMLENYIPDRRAEENFEGDRHGHRFTASIELAYKVPLQPICKELSRIFRQEVTRDDLQPFLNDFYPEEMNLDGTPEKIQDSGFYDIWDMTDTYSEELGHFLESDPRTRMTTEIEIEDVDGDYLIANAYISVWNDEDYF